MRLLVIEDNRNLTANLFDYFESRGHTLDAAPDGITGLYLAATHPYDAIILDWMLPRLEGPEGVEVIGLERDQAVSGRWRGTFFCRSRGAHRLVVQALRVGVVVETLERELAVTPDGPEGARLEVDHAALRQLAERGGGYYAAEGDESWTDWLAVRWTPAMQTETVAVISSGPWFLLGMLALMLLEWWLRRKNNLV